MRTRFLLLVGRLCVRVRSCACTTLKPYMLGNLKVKKTHYIVSAYSNVKFEYLNNFFLQHGPICRRRIGKIGRVCAPTHSDLQATSLTVYIYPLTTFVCLSQVSQVRLKQRITQ